jgi:hypothetical protein
MAGEYEFQERGIGSWFKEHLPGQHHSSADGGGGGGGSEGKKLKEIFEDPQKLEAGLKETLHVIVNQTIDRVGKPDGFLGNAAIKILVPQKFDSAVSAMKKIGLGGKIDEFEVSMNRAAEEAAPAGREVLKTTISELKLDDLKSLWKGSNTAITDLFHEKMAAPLKVAFAPIVDKTVAANGVARHYDQIHHHAKSIPFFGSMFELDIHEYVTSKAVEGLFVVCREEEIKIRQDPGERANGLLKALFR